MEDTGECFLLTNQALHDICFRALKLTAPACGDPYHLVSAATSGVATNNAVKAMNAYPVLTTSPHRKQ